MSNDSPPKPLITDSSSENFEVEQRFKATGLNPPPIEKQGWYKSLNKNLTNNENIPTRTLSDAMIYSLAANNPLQKPEEIVKVKTNIQNIHAAAPMTNPIPRRTRMYAYNPYQQRAGMYQ